MSLEQRGLAVVSTSGVLVGLLFGFVAIFDSGRWLELPGGPRMLLGLALGSFLSAAIFGLLCGWPRPHKEGGTKELRDLIEPEVWGEVADVGAQRAARLRWDVLEVLRSENKRKANLLVAALWAEIAAVTLIVAGLIVRLVA